jgi:hypothetical protein
VIEQSYTLTTESKAAAMLTNTIKDLSLSLLAINAANSAPKAAGDAPWSKNLTYCRMFIPTA